VHSRFARGVAPRRVMLIAVMAAFALALAACGGGDHAATTKPADGKTANAGPLDRDASGTIDFWTWNNEGDYVKVDEAAVQRFKEQYPNVEVKITYTPFADYMTKMKAALAAGNPPDIAQVPWDSSFREVVQSKKLAPMTDVLKKGFPAFSKQAKQFVTLDGQQWALPLDVNTLQIAYNKNLFEEEGLEPPTSMDELISLSQTLEAKDKYGIALGTKDKWAGGDAWFAQLAYTDPTGEKLRQADAGKLSWDDPAFQDAANNVDKLVKAKVFAPGSPSMGAFNESLDLFVGQKAAMFYPVGNFISGGIDQKVAGAFEWGLFPFPSPDGGEARATGGIARMFSLPKDGKNQELAAEFLRALTDKQGEETLTKYSFIPSWPVKTPADASPLFRDFLKVQETASSRTIYTAKVNVTLLDNMQRLLDGKADGAAVSQALVKAAGAK
jgi:raffinose/stachyose/melibiose transport system substrate-binding protein